MCFKIWECILPNHPKSWDVKTPVSFAFLVVLSWKTTNSNDVLAFPTKVSKLFLTIFLWSKKNFLPLKGKKYLFYSLIVFGLFLAPFVVSSPIGFLKAQSYIDNRPDHPLWGWNLWSGLEKFFTLPTIFIRFIRGAATITTLLIFFLFIKIDKFHKVFVGASLTLFVYLILSQWTSHAYFTFLIPLIGLGSLKIED